MASHDAAITQFALSLLTVSRGSASKKLVADADGRPVRDPTQQLSIASGTVEHLVLDGLEGLRTLLEHSTTRQVLIDGIPRQSQPGDRFRLVVSSKFTGALTNDHPRYFDSGETVQAGRLTAKMDAWTLADPAEPEEGRGKAKLYWRCGDRRITSWAHGVKRVYRLAQADAPPVGRVRGTCLH